MADGCGGRNRQIEKIPRLSQSRRQAGIPRPPWPVKLYAPYASTMASPVKEVPLLISMLFGQHKKIIALEKKVLTLETILKKPLTSSDILDIQETPSGTQTAAQLD